jgi:hypothetical protein
MVLIVGLVVGVVAGIGSSYIWELIQALAVSQ